MRDFVPLPDQEHRDITIYRGQKLWDRDAYEKGISHITAASMRRAWGTPLIMEQWTDALLQGFQQTLIGARIADPMAIKRLETMLLNAQQYAYLNPFASCSFSRSIALSFALADDSPGFLLTIQGNWLDGLDFEYFRRRFRYWGDAVDHLQEFGLSKELRLPFQILLVENVHPSGNVNQVYP